MGMQSIGNIIKQERIRLGITQQQLCDGICEPSTMSKIENDEQNPSRSTFLALFQRLGIVADRFYCLHNFDELEKEDLKLQIKSANYQRDYKKALSLLDTLINNYNNTDKISQQFILHTRAINGFIVNENVERYSSEKRTEMMHTALKYTVPRIDLENICSFFLTADEILIILALANEHINNENYLEAINIYRQLFIYVQTKMLPVTESGILLPLIAANYSLALGKMQQNEKELQVIEAGIQSCIVHGKSRMLGTLLINKACVLHRLNQVDEGKHFAIRSYYVLSALENHSDAEIVKEYLLDTYNYTVD